MNGLMLHVGGIEVDRKALAQFKAPEPRVRELIRKDLHSLPSVGKTIYPAVRAHKEEDGA